MNLQKLIDVAKQIEGYEPKVLEGVKHVLDTFGPQITALFPKLGGSIDTIKADLDFLSKVSDEFLPILDKILDFLTKLEAVL